VQVFEVMRPQNKIKTSATGLFIRLAQAAKTGDLNMPAKVPAQNVHVQPAFKGDPDHPNIQWAIIKTPQNNVLA